MQAARWRLRRARLVFKLFGISRLRFLRVAKRFWRWRVGLEAWWTWSGEMYDSKNVMDSIDGDDPMVKFSGAQIPYVHGDESIESLLNLLDPS